jgi:hypothetical protein
VATAPVAVTALGALVAAVALAVGGGVTAVGAEAGVAGVHSNHVSVTPQVVTDGEVIVDSAFVLTDGYLVVHEDDGGEPGAVRSHRALSEGFHDDVRIDAGTVDGRTDLYLVLHRDDGDGEFEPGEDPALTSFGRVAGERVTVTAGDQPVYLLSRSFAPDESDGTVTVDRVAAPDPALVVVRADAGGDRGRVVGTSTVPAGVSHDVTVGLSSSFYADQRDSFQVSVTLHRDDGDGEYDGEAAVTVGGEPVRTLLAATKGNATGVVTAPATATTTTASTATAAPSATATTDATATVETPTPTDATDAASASAPDTGTDGTGGGQSLPGPGPGTAAVAVALAVGGLLAWRRRRPGG